MVGFPAHRRCMSSRRVAAARQGACRAARRGPGRRRWGQADVGRSLRPRSQGQQPRQQLRRARPRRQEGGAAQPRGGAARPGLPATVRAQLPHRLPNWRAVSACPAWTALSILAFPSCPKGPEGLQVLFMSVACRPASARHSMRGCPPTVCRQNPLQVSADAGAGLHGAAAAPGPQAGAAAHLLFRGVNTLFGKIHTPAAYLVCGGVAAATRNLTLSHKGALHVTAAAADGCRLCALRSARSCPCPCWA